jgi:hypothetical protein
MQKCSVPNTIILTLALLFGNTAALATDITLLAGYQFNSDFEIGESDEAAPNPASVGTPGDDLELDGGAAFSIAVDFLFNNNPNQRIGFYATHHKAEFDSSAGLVDNAMDVTHIHFTAMN